MSSSDYQQYGLEDARIQQVQVLAILKQRIDSNGELKGVGALESGRLFSQRMGHAYID